MYDADQSLSFVREYNIGLDCLFTYFNFIKMVFDYFDKYIFICEMYDADADEIRELILNFFPFDNAVAVLDPKRGKSLLKRTQLPTLTTDMLQIGNVVNIFAKLLVIVDCAPLTRRTLLHKVESTFAMIKPVSPDKHGKVITFIMNNGFRITRMKNGKISKDFALELYKHLSGLNAMPIVVDYVTSGEVIGLELVGQNAIKRWKEVLGATEPSQAEPGTLRRLYGENILRNIAHGCNDREESDRMLDLFFGYDNGVPKVAFSATMKNCTCCIIKPHAVLDGNVGAILELISTTGKFQISAMAMFNVRIADANEFCEIYNGVVPEYKDMAIHLAEGKCIVLEIKHHDENAKVVEEFRKLCGPRDPELCRQLYPETIRALYGKDMVHNAVHCTDLPEDGEEEVEYFFKLISSHLK